jgi:phospholipid/cholesterol/gamma-HCH transport system substrate-binding protein
MSRAFRLGLFILATLAILALGSFLIGQRQFLFSRTYHVTTTFRSASELDEGADVRVGGIRRGVVTRIELPPEPDGSVTVEMKLQRSTRSVLRADSVASLETEGLLGNKYVAIAFGSADAPEVQDGGSIPSEPPVDMGDVLKQTNALLDSVKDIAAKVNAGEGTLGALVNDPSLYVRLNRTTTQAQQGATAFTEDMNALKHNFFLRGFFNNRGYTDSAKLTEHAIAKLPAATPAKTFRFDTTKLFADVEHAKLRNEKTLNDAGEYLAGHPFALAVVAAQHGMTGDADDMHVLTQAQAMVVRDYLVQHFAMDDARVKTIGLGKTPQGPPDGGAVEIRVYARAGGAPRP